MARRYRPQLKASDEVERFMARRRLPSEFWKVLLKDFSFRSTPFRGEKLSAVAQRKWCESVVVDPPNAPFFVVASYPTDRAATALVTWMLRHRMTTDRRIIYMDGQRGIHWENIYTTIGMHNAIQEATPARCECIRDTLVEFEDAFRVVAVATKNPEAWALNKIHLRPTAVFFLKDM